MIIYGTDKKDSGLKVGRQTCPACGQDGEYKLKRTDFVFTLCFILCFPLGTFDMFAFTFLIFWFIYFVLCELFTKGYTIGKRLLSVRTSVSYEFKPLNLLDNIIGALVKTLSCIVPVVFLFVFWSRGNRVIHDWAGGSIVVSKLKTKLK